MAWLDPMCGLMLAFAVAAAVWRRRSGGVARVDFSMIEAMLWTMAEPLLSEQGLAGEVAETGVVSRCDGPDDWCAVEPTAWGTASASLARSGDLVVCPHLRARQVLGRIRGRGVTGTAVAGLVRAGYRGGRASLAPIPILCWAKCWI